MKYSTLIDVSIAWSLVAIAVFFLLLFVSAPYGRHNRKGWGPQVNNKWGWFWMEILSWAIMAYTWVVFEMSLYASILCFLWVAHYTYRTFLFPLRIKTSGKQMPLVIVLSAVIFNGMNAGLNALYFADFEVYSASDFASPQFVIGAALFVGGAVLHHWSDGKLIRLRKSANDTSYHIPRGGMFELVSCPNMLGELVQWIGFAVMAGNWPAWTFAIWTAANLLPRAFKHHSWYLSRFPDYPKSRKAILPFIR